MYIFLKFLAVLLFLAGFLALVLGSLAIGGSLISIAGSIMIAAILFESLAKHLRLQEEQVKLLKIISQQLGA
jgi:uncharacterized membrane protein